VRKPLRRVKLIKKKVEEYRKTSARVPADSISCVEEVVVARVSDYAHSHASLWNIVQPLVIDCET